MHTGKFGQNIDLPIGKVVCVGRNYMLHIKELNNEVPQQPILFMKPATALCSLAEPVVIPQDLGECHNETEVAILIKQTLSCASVEQTQQAIWGVGLGLDLTLRDVQSTLKSKGHPWERAKAFDGSCPMSKFIPITEFSDLNDVEFNLFVNNELRQQGNTSDMMISILDLLVEITKQFTLLPGDIVMTGTPKGVASLNPGDELTVELADVFSVSSHII
jgi:2-keto-4-pentenoate hydratase/2-oxohepta-3-ene-1,7-dioic acid hydratase in catechol pathway